MRTEVPVSRNQPVMSVDRVDLRWESDGLRIAATGSTSTLGWSAAALQPVVRTGESLELVLVARPPTGMAAQAIGEVDADILIADAEAMRSVRVSSAGNRVDCLVPRR